MDDPLHDVRLSIQTLTASLLHQCQQACQTWPRTIASSQTPARVPLPCSKSPLLRWTSPPPCLGGRSASHRVRLVPALVSSAIERESSTLLVTPYCRFTDEMVRRAGFFALFDLGPRRSVRSLAELLSGVDLLASNDEAFVDGVPAFPPIFTNASEVKSPLSSSRGISSSKWVTSFWNTEATEGRSRLPPCATRPDAAVAAPLTVPMMLLKPCSAKMLLSFPSIATLPSICSCLSPRSLPGRAVNEP